MNFVRFYVGDYFEDFCVRLGFIRVILVFKFMNLMGLCFDYVELCLCMFDFV